MTLQREPLFRHTEMGSKLQGHVGWGLGRRNVMNRSEVFMLVIFVIGSIFSCWVQPIYGVEPASQWPLASS